MDVFVVKRFIHFIILYIFTLKNQIKRINNNMTKLITPELLHNICTAYQDTSMSTTQLRKMFRMNLNRIYDIIKQNDIPLRGKEYSIEFINNIKNLYKQNIPLKQIAEKMNIKEQTVLRVLKTRKIPKRGINSGQFKRKYTLDETIFEKIDTFEKAQFLGLIYSDGTMASRNKTISIRLREDDIEYLDKWRDILLKTDRPLLLYQQKGMIGPTTDKWYKTKYKTAILDISSSGVYKDALKIGLCPGKTWKDLPMPKLPKKLIPAFILGLFEGDGCVAYCNKNRSQCFSIAGQKNMLTDIQKYFQTKNIHSNLRFAKFVYTLNIARREDFLKIYKLLYTDAKHYMVRKKEKFEFILKERDIC